MTQQNNHAKVVSFSLPQDLEKRLKALCDLTNQKRTTLLRNLIIDELKNHSLLDADYTPDVKAGRPKIKQDS